VITPSPRSPEGGGGNPHPEGSVGNVSHRGGDEDVVTGTQADDDLAGGTESGVGIERREDLLGAEREGEHAHEPPFVEDRADGESERALR
jgi:hypothetical protein